MSTGSFFVAGLMQGARPGADLADQSYRQELREVIGRHRPDAVVSDPVELLLERFAGEVTRIRAAHAALAGQPVLRRDRLDPVVLELIDAFHEMTELAAASDVCVAWLPGREPSMGTAMEMYRAYLAGRTVVAITEMRQTLAILACSTVILPDLAAFEEWLVAEAP
ncbi:hypothetical protein [Actinoplanes regularis]|uniref:Uncharacterized protein n=1 Tax=Actinoplanes regularis TaxID=52697 RepID=A0A238VZ36_9ACTN|nr:hypothetical protein [Actinoplanes regularis]GIE91937.1 hypothetical protein Are01nite_84170 [Actinoplanes regularis]GLW27611.1 hypothetical protein Areg01_05520 [Actinoplanes regularis]SNR39498.1 hypothetical protein SAMN06264365_1023 [Actinoplanes regularis]